MPARDALETLEAIRSEFGPRAARRRRALLRRLGREPPDDASRVRRLHDLCLFHAAFPDDSQTFALVSAHLRRIADAVRRAPRLRRALEDSGIAGTRVDLAPSRALAAWLTRRFGRHVRLAWESEDDEEMERVLPLLTRRVERDGLIEESLTTREWIRRASGGASDAAWLVRAASSIGGDEEVLDYVFQSLDRRVWWDLPPRGPSRTFLRGPARAIHFQRRPPPRPESIEAEIHRPIERVARLRGSPARRLIDTARATLAVRLRETDPFTYANPEEVVLYRLDRGIDVAMFGMSPGRRLPIESFFGFLLLKNRVPIGYGGGWPFGARCEIGVNIFESFRGGDSLFAFAQVLRVYRHAFAAERFYVDPFQFGAGNTEAIRSGAFWFYWRLGFRPVEPRLAALASQEAARVASRRGDRSPPSVLRRLAGARLVLHLAPAPREPDIDLCRVGLAATDVRARRFGGDRRRALERCAATVARRLGAAGWMRWPVRQREAFAELAVLVAMIPDLPRWSAAERRALLKLMRAKGGPRETAYVRAVQMRGRFLQALRDISAR